MAYTQLLLSLIWLTILSVILHAINTVQPEPYMVSVGVDPTCPSVFLSCLIRMEVLRIYSSLAADYTAILLLRNYPCRTKRPIKDQAMRD